MCQSQKYVMHVATANFNALCKAKMRSKFSSFQWLVTNLEQFNNYKQGEDTTLNVALQGTRCKNCEKIIQKLNIKTDVDVEAVEQKLKHMNYTVVKPANYAHSLQCWIGFNAQGLMHSDNGPAIVHKNGNVEYYTNGIKQ